MSTFINTPYATEHPGVQRAESAIQGALLLRQRWSAFSGLVALLLTAVAAAVLVVAYQVMDSMVEGHLLVLWMALWALAFWLYRADWVALLALLPAAAHLAWQVATLDGTDGANPLNRFRANRWTGALVAAACFVVGNA